VVLGFVLLGFGLIFALTPLSVARATDYFRFVPIPSSPTNQQMRYFRIAGLVFAAAGIALIIVD
jgi:hypothetical protein